MLRQNSNAALRGQSRLCSATKSTGLEFALVQEKATSIAQILLAWLLSAEHQPAGRGGGGGGIISLISTRASAFLLRLS